MQTETSGRESVERDGIPIAEARRTLREVMAGDAPFEGKARAALELGVEYLGVKAGHLTRVDARTDHWEVVVSTDSRDGAFPRGLERDLSRTYCRRTLAADGPVRVHDASARGWENDPGCRTLGLRCYHGTTLALDDGPYGTVCFVSSEPRDDPFTEGETLFVELLTRSLGRELERERHERELAGQSNLANVLTRVLRHNLRNDMCVIRGYTEMVAEGKGSDSYADRALEKIDEFIRLSEKTHKLEQVVGGERDRTPTDLAALVDRLVESIEPAYPDASITTSHPESVTGAVRPSFKLAVHELIENAVKHGGDAPSVSVTVEHVPDAVEVRVTDDGPGLPRDECKVLETGVETPLVHGSGLGLWLVHWVVTSHDGTVDATVTDEGTTVTVSVPPSPRTDAREAVATVSRAPDRYRAAFRAAVDPMLLVDDETRIVCVNRAAAETAGVDREAFLGRPLRAFLRDEAGFETAWADVLETGDGRGTVTVVDADGDTTPVEYSATADVVPGQHLLVLRPGEARDGG